MTKSIIDQLLICQSLQKPVVNVIVKLDYMDYMDLKQIQLINEFYPALRVI